jgi:hypothetical protein
MGKSHILIFPETDPQEFLRIITEILGDHRRQTQKSGRSLGWVSALDLEGRTIWIVDAHRDGNRFIIRADEKLDCTMR